MFTDIILNLPFYAKTNKLEVDHINRDVLDNRKKNLRIVTHQLNCRNRYLYKTNTSGCAGVYCNKQRSKWSAEIIISRKKNQRHFLGYFTNINNAIRVRKAAEIKYLTGEQ